jgi:hypothetical protein
MFNMLAAFRSSNYQVSKHLYATEEEYIYPKLPFLYAEPAPNVDYYCY